MEQTDFERRVTQFQKKVRRVLRGLGVKTATHGSLQGLAKYRDILKRGMAAGLFHRCLGK